MTSDETGGSMKQARPTQQDIEQLFYLAKLAEELVDQDCADEDHNGQPIVKTLEDYKDEAEAILSKGNWQRAYYGMYAAFENASDPNSDVMKFKPEIEQWKRDSKLLAMLNDKRQDDHEVLSMEWANKLVYWTWSEESPDRFELEDDNGLIQLAVVSDGPTPSVIVYERYLTQITTRGQFRALCKALSIEMREGV
jgi:hypothetical protein